MVADEAIQSIDGCVYEVSSSSSARGERVCEEGEERRGEVVSLGSSLVLSPRIVICVYSFSFHIDRSHKHSLTHSPLSRAPRTILQLLERSGRRSDAAGSIEPSAVPSGSGDAQNRRCFDLVQEQRARSHPTLDARPEVRPHKFEMDRLCRREGEAALVIRMPVILLLFGARSASPHIEYTVYTSLILRYLVSVRCRESRNDPTN